MFYENIFFYSNNFTFIKSILRLFKDIKLFIQYKITKAKLVDENNIILSQI